jgi:hypothetical protein
MSVTDSLLTAHGALYTVDCPTASSLFLSDAYPTPVQQYKPCQYLATAGITPRVMIVSKAPHYSTEGTSSRYDTLLEPNIQFVFYLCRMTKIVK